MKLSTQPYKGARDFYPEDMRLQQYIFDTWQKVCEAFGYEQYDTPILEPTELYLSKGSQEIVNEQTFSFTDRGKRNITFRTEMTPSVSRLVASRRQELSYPLRWYSMPQCWRYERMQRGRGREFYQLNVDLFGVASLDADFEIIQIADAVMKAFGAMPDMYRIEISSRKLLNELAERAGIKDTAAFIRLVDSKAKIPEADFMAKLKALATNDDGVEIARYVLNLKSLEGLRSGLNFDSLEAVRKLLEKLETLLIDGSKTHIVFNPATARGFEYYTDIVFEVFDTNPENNRSMFGGGRYDGLVELFGAEAVPTVGFGMGDITLKNFLETHKLLPTLATPTDVYAVLIGDVFVQAQKILTALRTKGVNVALDSTGRKIDRQLKSATKKGIKYALFIGEKELASNQYELKNLETGKSQTVSLNDIVKAVG